jgi:hypothetical protein
MNLLKDLLSLEEVKSKDAEINESLSFKAMNDAQLKIGHHLKSIQNAISKESRILAQREFKEIAKLAEAASK